VTCPQCAFETPPGMAFCGRCGPRLAFLCPSCGFANPEGFAFCGKCGARVADVTAPSLPLQAPPAFASPWSYTPKHLAEKILTSKSTLEGERKQVTVLFADLKGSMELLADRDPEEARKLLDPVLERMMEAVHRYEGTVNQVMGDGIMALFGAPLAHEDHAVRVCYTALDLQRAMRRLTETLRQSHGVTVEAARLAAMSTAQEFPKAIVSFDLTTSAARPRRRGARRERSDQVDAGTPAGPLLDDLIRSRQHRGRDREAQGLGGPEVDHELELRRELDR
jgi:hypothetical protein